MTTKKGTIIGPRGPECATYAPLLALLATEELAGEERARVRAHVDRCGYCRAALAADAIVVDAVRWHFGGVASAETAADGTPPLKLNEITALLHDAAPSRTAPKAPLAKTRSRSRARFSGLGAVAAVLVIALLAGVLFTSRTLSRTPAGPPDASLMRALATTTVYVGTSDGVYALRASDGTPRWHALAHDQSAGGGGIAVTGMVAGAGVVYAVSSAPAIQTDPATITLYALRASDGHVLWQSGLLACDTHAGLAVADGILYITPQAQALSTDTTADQLVYALRARDGAVLWNYQAPEPVLSLPLVAGGSLYFGTANHVYALTSAGAVRWSAPIGPSGGHPEGYSTARVSGLALALENQLLYVDMKIARKSDSNGPSQYSAQVIGLDARTGAGQGWGDGLPPDGYTMAYAPVFFGGRWIAEGGSGLWATETGGSLMTAWFAGVGTSVTGPVLADGVVYATGLDGTVYAVRAQDGHALWHARVGPLSAPRPPAVQRGAVFVAGDHTITALNARNGVALWHFGPSNAQITASPVAQG